MAVLNRVKVSTNTVGMGPVSLGAAFAGFQSFAAAGAKDGARYSYTIEDASSFELGTGIYNATAQTLTREMSQSSTGSLLNLSGQARLFVTALTRDIPGYEINEKNRKLRVKLFLEKDIF